MKKTLFIICMTFLIMCNFACAPKWTEQDARQEAFRDVQYRIDASGYPLIDPDLQENQRALKEGQGRVGDRFISSNPEPPVGYVVSKLDERNRPRITMFYKKDGRLLSVRLFSKPDYPRVAYIYCAEDGYVEDGKEYKAGELMSVSFHISGREAFYFRPNGRCTGHVKF